MVSGAWCRFLHSIQNEPCSRHNPVAGTETLLAAIKADSVNQKTEVITQAWKNFQKEIKKDGKKEEYEALALNAEEEYDRMVSSVASPKKSSNLDKIKKILS